MLLSEQLIGALLELDEAGAPDSEYRKLFSTASKRPLKRGETWRQRLLGWINHEIEREARA